jgi:hypothetical protein
MSLAECVTGYQWSLIEVKLDICPPFSEKKNNVHACEFLEFGYIIEGKEEKTRHSCDWARYWRPCMPAIVNLYYKGTIKIMLSPYRNLSSIEMTFTPSTPNYTPIKFHSKINGSDLFSRSFHVI